MTYRLSGAAEEDVIGIYVAGVSALGLAQADRYHAGLERIFAFLGDHPEAARERGELRQRPRAFRYKAHLVFHRIDGGEIVILRVRHGREDWLGDG